MFLNRNRTFWLLFAVIVTIAFPYLLISFLEGTSTGYNHLSGVDVRTSRKFRNVIVHIDLKGAPPRVEYLQQVFELLSRQHVDGVLIEYEDMFPYSGEIENITRMLHYSEADVRRIIYAAEINGLEVIPLIQSFGHLEFVLKSPAFMHLSEDTIDYNTICISDKKSIEIVQQMILQIRKLHPNSTRIHIGADEAYHVGEDHRCRNRMTEERIEKSQLKMNHIAQIGKFAKNAGFKTVFAWNDMFDKESEIAIRRAKIHEYIVPVIWGYREDVTEPGYFPDGLFDRIANIFDGFYVASAFKGADGQRQQFSNISRYLEVQRSYVKLMDLHQNAGEMVQGIFVTGWSRFNHFNALCELLPVAIPSLIVDLFYLNYQFSATRSWEEMKKLLSCRTNKHKGGLMDLYDCQFPGSDAFEIVMNDWKQIVDRRIQGRHDSPQDNVIAVLEKLKKSLQPILYQADIDEIYNQYLHDYHAIRIGTTVES
uniref:beta-N-acetylhexosaminidase n=1 Tax=Caenorhabditis japonica TaxID=281687 RepID=A0A8R1HMW2_CAEJA